MSPMLKVHTRRYLSGDHLMIKLQAAQRINPAHDYMIAANIAGGPTFTILANDRVLAVGGFCHIWTGRVLAWGFVDKNIPMRAWPQIRRIIREKMDQICSDVPRLECQVPVKGRFKHFAEGLGFHMESVLEKFDGKNNYYMGVKLCN